MRARIRLQFASILEPLNRWCRIAIGLAIKCEWIIFWHRRIHGMFDDMWIFTWREERSEREREEISNEFSVVAAPQTGT